jgi:RNA polymerase sigma-70 factor (ECF subfamily)
MAIVTDRLSAQEAVDLIVATLPADQSEVLVLRIVADLDVAHVAELLGHTPNWVRVTQHRALRRLAEALESGQRRAAHDGATAGGGVPPRKVV